MNMNGPASIAAIGKIIPAGANELLTPAIVFQQILSAADEWVKVHQTEITKRAVIAAHERTLIEEIRARRDVFLGYLDRSFDERRRTFTQLFASLDRSMTEDPAHVPTILQAISRLASQSPFADLQDLDLVREHLADETYEWTA